MPPKTLVDRIHRQVEQEQLRSRVLALYRAGNMSLAQIAGHPEVQKSRSTVQSIIRNFNNRVTTERKKGSGRRSKISKRCF